MVRIHSPRPIFSKTYDGLNPGTRSHRTGSSEVKFSSKNNCLKNLPLISIRKQAKQMVAIVTGVVDSGDRGRAATTSLGSPDL